MAAPSFSMTSRIPALLQLCLVCALLVCVVAVTIDKGMAWKHWVEAQAQYLNEPAVRLANGRTVTRKEILDLLIVERLQGAPQR